MTRTHVDMSAHVRPGDKVLVSMLGPDGLPTGTSFRADVDASGRYQGFKQVRAGRAAIYVINRPPAARR
ncbi:MAG: hypothetical protein JWQ81_6511 [Amycolatopsis sp.]|uniref:hypothetical protein n=1 Tax=Amycolatopsis sp. TaxID=37632 RepID=UPI002603BB14|nr:hypothetical protein [Amycolatopsis sp.]MCU1685772.1 hypothetical protein [Amycolatopsis sp.]